jgi:predicted PurR-regulated permease PerM
LHMDKAVRVVIVIIATVLAAALLIFMLFRLRGLLCTIIISIVLAYLLNKPLKAMEKRMKRPWALLIMFGVLAGTAALFLFYVAPLFVRQAADLVAYIPKLLDAVGRFLVNAGNQVGEPLTGFISQAIDGFNRRAADWLGTTTISLAQGCSAWAGWALLMPVFGFYFLKDHEHFIDQLNYLIPIRYHEDLHALYLSIDKAVGHFLRGQLLVSLAVAVMTSAGLLIIGVPNALLLGLICGLCNLIPYIGPFIGAVPVALVSIMLGWKKMLISVLVILVVQQLDNMVISPKIIGDSIKINPAYIIIAIIAGSGLFGIMGLVLALPMLIIIKEILVFLFRKRLYSGKHPKFSNEKN